MYPDPLEQLFQKQLLAYFPEARQQILKIPWGQVQRTMLKLPKEWTNAIIKTLCGGWTTVTRLHETPTGVGYNYCCLGCQARDTVAHYLQCKRFQDLIDSVLGRLTPSCPVAPLGLDPPSPESLVIGVAAFH
eukprot:8576297-Pyramimonas_sp.AAC.1